MKRLAFACACTAFLIGAPPQIQAQTTPPGRLLRPFPGDAHGSLPNDAGKKDDRDRSFGPAHIPHLGHVPTSQFRPEPAELNVRPVEPSFKAPPVTEFHSPVRPGGVGGKVVGGVIGSIGAAIAAAFRAIFGLPRAKDGEA